MTNQDSILKSRDITLPTKVHLVKFFLWSYMDVRIELWRKLRAEELMLLNCGVGEDSWIPWTARRSNQSILREIGPECSLEGLCWSWNSNSLATWCKELTHLKRPWCWERLKAGGEGDDRGWNGWMASPAQWTWVWVNSGSWWWTGRSGVLRFMGSQRVRHNWATELNWTKLEKRTDKRKFHQILTRN